MSKHDAEAKRVMLERRGARPTDLMPPSSTAITEDGFELLVSKQFAKQLGNAVSEKTGKKLTRDDASAIMRFLQKLPARRYIGIPFGDAVGLLADQFIKKGRVFVREEEDIVGMMGIDEITDDPAGEMHEYQKKEINSLTTDEHPLKLTSHHNRRGDAVIDQDRVRRQHIMGDRSSVNNLIRGKNRDEAQIDLMGETLATLKAIGRTVNAESIEELFLRSRQGLQYTTFENVTLPHQIIPLDSRYRLPTHTPVFEYKWNLHAAGFEGSLGDIRMQDTLKEIIRMKVCPFWIPVTNINHGYYGKIRMLVKEFVSQSAQTTEFLKDCTQRIRHYHFEFQITRRDLNRFYLEPCNSGIFTFRKPFARPETLTISFTAPFEQILPDVDCLVASVTNANPAVFTTTEDHNLATGDLVYPELFESADPAINREINREQGHVITRLSDTTFSIPIDTSSLAGPVNDVKVYFGSKRLIIPIEFTSLEQ